jgi:alpha-mannosidase
MSDKTYFCVISHTHWDREWYMPFEQFRVRLVELMDRLFDILDAYPAYVFHLDAQTIVLEDYLEIRPWRRERLMKLVAEGNILVGPWYLQNDFYLTSGEATIRNLLVGTRIAEEFGHCTRAGYAPDQFGNISQLPQILNQFGVDNFIFGRGYGKYLFDENGTAIRGEDGNPVREKAPTEFLWEGPDGSRLLAIHMKYWYNNAQRIYADTTAATAFLDVVENSFKGFATTPYLLLMNGVDHLEAQEDLLPVLTSINDRLQNGSEIRQYSMTQYIDLVKGYFRTTGQTPAVHRGELRDGHDWEILKGTLSSRVYLKHQNCRAQAGLESVLEPMSAMYELAGADRSYDNDYLKYLWKQLLKNHPHDSICGCSRDEVHDHMEDLYARLKEASGYLEEKKAADIAAHAEINTRNPEDNIICLINTVSTEHVGPVEADVMFLASEQVQAFDLVDARDVAVDFTVIGVEERRQDVFTALNLPGVLDVKVFRILVMDDGTKGFAVRGLKIRKTGAFRPGQQQTGVAYVEAADFPVTFGNEHIRVSVGRDGRIGLSYPKEGRVVENALVIEDRADCGDAYVYRTNAERARYSVDFPASVAVSEMGGMRTSVRVVYAMDLPAEFDFAADRRSAATVPCPVALTLTLDRQSPIVKVTVSFANAAKDHRLRLLVDTGIRSAASFGDIPFDIPVHDIRPACPTTHSNVHPNTSFAGIGEGRRGVAVFTYGNHEYEHLPTPWDEVSEEQKEDVDLRNDPAGSVLAFTLVRSNAFIMIGGDNKSGGGPQWDVPGNQCLRVIRSEFGITAYHGDRSVLAAQAQAFRVPAKAVFASCDAKKFAGGRFAMQGSTLNEFYYLPDLFPTLVLPDNRPVVDVQGENILVSAFKKAHDGDGFVLRLVNMNDVPEAVSVGFDGCIADSAMDERSGTVLSDGDDGMTLLLTLKAKEIRTLFLTRR